MPGYVEDSLGIVFGVPVGGKDLLCSPKHPDRLSPTQNPINRNCSNCSAAKAAGT
jgi:hypothetical protein